MPVSALIGDTGYPLEEILDYLRHHVQHLTMVDAEQAASDLGSAKVLNVVLLGAAARSGELGLGVDDLRQAVHQKMPEKVHALNDRALNYTSR